MRIIVPFAVLAIFQPLAAWSQAAPAANAAATNAAYLAARAQFENPANRFEYASIAQQLRDVLEVAPDAHDARLLRVAALIKAGDRRAAGEEMKRVVAARDKLDETQHLRLRVLAANLAGKPQEEIRFLTQLVDREPENRWLQYELARANADLEAYALVVQHIEQALALDNPGDRWEASWLHYLHSKALLRGGGDPRAAVAAALAGRGEATTWQPTLYRLALAQYASGDADGGGKSLDEYVESVRREGRMSEGAIQRNLGLFFYELRDYKQAEKHLRDGLELGPESTYTLRALGYLLIEKPGGLAEGKALIERGLEKAPNDADLLDARGWALYRENRAAEGYSWLRRAQLAGGGYSQRIADHLAAVAAELKDSRRPPAPHTRWL